MNTPQANSVNPDPASTATPTVQHELVAIWRQFLRYRWSILGLGLVGALLGVLYAEAVTPMYRATTELVIESQPQVPLADAALYPPGAGAAEYFNTQVALFHSRSLAERVARNLDLAKFPEFASQPGPGALGKAWRFIVGFLSAGSPSEPDRPASSSTQSAAAVTARAAAILQQRISAEPVEKTQLVKLHVLAHDPALAARLANAVADAYMEQTLDERLEATRKATHWLTERIGDVQKALQKSQAALQQYRDQNNIVVVNGNRGLVNAQILNDQDQLQKAQATELALRGLYQQIKRFGEDPQRLDQISGLFPDQAVAQAKLVYTQALQKVEQLSQRYGPKYPKMQDAQAELGAARAAYFQQLRIAAQGVKTQYEIARNTEQQLSQAMADAKEQIRKLDQTQYQEGVLQRQVETNQQIYDTFLKQIKEAGNAESYHGVSMRVIDPAQVPSAPYYPKTSRAILLGLALGLFIGALLAWVRQLLEEGVSTPEALSLLTATPVLGVVPLVRDREVKRDLNRAFVRHPRSPFAESMRGLRTNLTLSEVNKVKSCIALVSASPQEGKSSCAAGLAAALATQQRVVLLEADLRRPVQARNFQIPAGHPDLMDYLLRKASLEDCIFHDAESNFDLLVVNKTPPNPGETIGSNAFAECLRELIARYDRVVVDTPPLLQGARDASVVASLADAVIVLVRAETTGQRLLAAALRQLQVVRAPLLGSVLSQLDPRKSDSAYVGYYARQY